jgi:hypothetical protein
MTELTQLSRPNVHDSDATILLGYIAFSVVLLVAIYFASMSPGTGPGAFESMTVFP